VHTESEIMNSTETITQSSEFFLRRLLDEMPAWGLFVPVAFVLLVLFLVLFFRQSDTVGDMLRRARIPSRLAGIVGLVWTAGLVFYLGYMLAWAIRGLLPDSTVVLAGGAVLLAFPLLLGLFIAVMLCVRKPRRLIPVAAVLGGCCLYLLAGKIFMPVFGWWVVLAPVLAIALLYVVLMYLRDAKTIHPAWAAFLGLLRCTVYCTLAAVFLLPGCQTFQTTETRSKVLVLFDVSGSMTQVVDDVPAAGEDPRSLLTRQGKVVKLLSDPGPGGKTFMERLQLKSPATLYRFGAVLDDVDVQQFLSGRRWDKAEWIAWLNPDRNKVEVPEKIGDHVLTNDEQTKLRIKLQNLHDDLHNGTNVSGAALQAAVREAGHLIQALIIVSDGRSNLGSAETARELRARATASRRPFHIITVGVGAYRQPVSIHVEDLLAPQQARPDDKFPVRVPVEGDGLQGEPFTVTLEATRVTRTAKDKWQPIPGEKWTLTKEGKFSSGGDHPVGEVEFEVDVRALRGIKPGDESKDDLVEGTWEFHARVPRQRLEAFPDAEHVSRPARIVIQKRKLRVLLFAGGPNRDYQFLRTLFYREVQEQRMELSIYLQSAAEKDVDQEVETERLLTHFPDKMGAEDPRDRHHNLSEYDVIIAFDPDWSKLSERELKLLKDWVSQSAGGLIFVAGPVNSYQLARPGGQDISALLTIMPVALKDSRLHGLGLDHDASRPYALNFPPAARRLPFLKIDEEAKEPLEGWDNFFWGEGGKPEPGKDVVPKRGFYNYYPVDKLRPGSEVLATFAGPASSRINDGKDEQPFLVSMRYGAGTTVYLGAGELWRLRQYRSAYYQVFWVKLARYAGGGNLGKLSRYGAIVMGSRARTGLVKVEAQVFGLDMQPLPRDARPVVQVVRPELFNEKTDRETPKSFTLKAKSPKGEWNGYFTGTFPVRTRGDYTLKIAIPGTAQSLTHDLFVDDPNPEMDVTRPDHGHLYQLATSARPLLAQLPAERRKEVLALLHAPVEEDKDGKKKADAPDSKDEARLYFPLSSAGVIPDLLTRVEPKKESTKGRVQDLWDKGLESGVSIRADYFIMLVAMAVGLLGCAILLFIRRWIAALAFLAAAALVVAGIALANLGWEPAWAELPLDMSFVLGLIVGLLSIEWLTRKLLKLA
jgi:hypothetical protein